MDNLCHSLAGLALAEAGIAPARRRTLVMAALAANAPDIDVVAAIGGYGLASLEFRRGVTHGVLAMVLWPLLIAGVTWAIGRRARQGQVARGEMVERFAPLLGLAALAGWSHTFLDWLNTYGVRLLAPFDWRWFYGDAVFIIDPWLWALFGLAFVIARRRRRRPQQRTRATRGARVVLGVAAAYIVAMLLIERLATRAVRREVASRALAETIPGNGRFMTAPRPVLPFTRSVVRDLGDRYETGTLRLGSGERYVIAATVADNATLPQARAAAAQREGATFLRWSRFPVFAPLDDARVRVYDLRYSSPDGAGQSWASVDVDITR